MFAVPCAIACLGRILTTRRRYWLSRGRRHAMAFEEVTVSNPGGSISICRLLRLSRLAPSNRDVTFLIEPVGSLAAILRG
jgi:hypothetical protein